MRESLRILTVTVISLVFWEMANRQLGTREPWDSPDYLAAYGCSLALAALAGFVFPRRAWLWGIIITFSQMVIMGIHNGGGPLMLVGLVLLVALSLPAVGFAVIASGLRELKKRPTAAP